MHKENLTQRISSRIRADILAGKYAYQEQLPSIAVLCEIHQVGRNTMRSVLRELENNNLIAQEKGKQAIVMFNLADQDDHLLFLQIVCGKAPYIKEVFQTLYLIMPDVSVYCIQQATDEDIADLKQLIAELKHKDLSSDRLFLDALMDVYSRVIRILHNDCILDLFTALMQYIYIGIPEHVQNHNKLEKMERYTQRVIGNIFEFILMGKPVMIKKSLQLMIATFSKATDSFVERYQQKNQIDTKSIPFVWKQKRSRDYLYVTIAADIVKQIISGVYHNSDRFMSIEELAEEYHVSTRTSRKVLQVLNDYQIISTVNGIGSFIHYDVNESVHPLINYEEMDLHAKEYKSALELMKICVHAISKEYVKQLEEETIEEMIMALNLEHDIDIHPLIEAIFQINEPLKTIYQELNRDMLWALSIVIIFPLHSYQAQLQQKREELIQALMRKQSKKIIHRIDDIMDIYYEHAVNACYQLESIRKKQV